MRFLFQHPKILYSSFVILFIKNNLSFFEVLLLFNFTLKISLIFLLIKEVSFILFENKISNILKKKNLGNKQIVLQEETFSLLREIAFYTIILFLSKFKLRNLLVKLMFSLITIYERIIIIFLLCFSLRETLDNKSLIKVKHSYITNFVNENNFCYQEETYSLSNVN